jgi:hypothetical protein
MAFEPKYVRMLDAAACTRAHELVTSMRRYWTSRHETLPSFTLGAACYLDVPDHGFDEYYRRLVRGNLLLLRRFGWLYEQLRLTLERELGATVNFTSRYALPGFHLFEGHPELRRLEPKAHVDLQDRDLDWEDGGARLPDTRMSFTVPITVPACGAGLWIWDERQKDRRYYAYTPGEMLLHSGDRVHQIANEHLPEPGEVRLTMQGHGRKTNDVWVLYW